MMKKLTKIEHDLAISIIERNFKELDWLDKVSDVLPGIWEFECFSYGSHQIETLYDLLDIPKDYYYERNIEDENGYCRQWTDEEWVEKGFYCRDWINDIEEYVKMTFPNIKERSEAFLNYLLDLENTSKINFYELVHGVQKDDED